MKSKKETMVGIRMDKELIEKLDSMAKATQRTRSQLIRLLLSRATLTKRPELELASPGMEANTEVVQ